MCGGKGAIRFSYFWDIIDLHTQSDTVITVSRLYLYTHTTHTSHLLNLLYNFVSVYIFSNIFTLPPFMHLKLIQDYPILMVSLDREVTDQESVVLNKILSIVKKEVSA
jgi:hypothetical protein